MTAAYLSAIEQTVKTHLIYPAQALRRREQGVVRVRMLVAADGSILSMEEDDQTASPLLVAAALQAVRDAAPFPPLPQGLAEKPVRLVVPVTFALRG
ncbi:MAG TPA: energy transducer TonB [Candidatus Sulfotelmatobacter sp.]|nr:energy transducer TonB [Candidatus Sulfotelmatobacter sp.]